MKTERKLVTRDWFINCGRMDPATVDTGIDRILSNISPHDMETIANLPEGKWQEACRQIGQWLWENKDGK